MRAELDIAEGRTKLSDYEGEVLPGEAPPPVVRELWNAILDANDSIFGSEQYTVANQKVQDIFAEQLWVIGTVGMVPSPYIASNNIGNRQTNSLAPRNWVGELDWALYFKN